MKKNIKLTCVLIFIFLTLISVVAFLCWDDFKEHQNEETMMIYMGNIPKSDDVAYVDQNGNVYFKDYTILAPKDAFYVLYVTENEVFYSAHSEDREYVYKVNHDGTNKEILLSHSELASENMPDENTIYYHITGDGYYVKNIREDTITQITKEKFESSYYENDYYKVDIEKTVIGGKIKEYRIYNKITGETKRIDNEQLKEILKIEVASKLSEYNELFFARFVLKDNNIYLICGGGYDIVTLYSYDFKTGRITFFDWYKMEGEVLSIKDIFVM